MKIKKLSYPTLPPDPIGDVLAACYRRLLTRVAQEEKSQHGEVTVGNGTLGLNSKVAKASTRTITSSSRPIAK